MDHPPPGDKNHRLGRWFFLFRWRFAGWCDILGLVQQIGSWEETNVEDNKSTNVKKTVKSGITFGSALAMVISYTTWKSVGWAIFHGLLSWVYVIYFLLRY